MHGAAHIFRSQTASLFVGTLGDVAPHTHRSAAMLLPLDGPIEWRAEGGRCQTCFGAWIPPRCTHGLACTQRKVAVLYFDPLHYGSLLPNQGLALARGQDSWSERAAGHLTDALPALLVTGDLTHTESFCVQELLPRALGKAPAAPVQLGRDVRDVLHETELRKLSLSQVARALSLSPSRFSHLFSAQFGLSWTAYRNWRRLLTASTDLCRDPTGITALALRLGYSSHAHLSASMRQGFGITPTQLRALQPQVRGRSAR